MEAYQQRDDMPPALVPYPIVVQQQRHRPWAPEGDVRGLARARTTLPATTPLHLLLGGA
jgi:hypothetical protein